MQPALPKYHHRCVFYDEPKESSRAVDEKGIGYTKCLHKRQWEASPYLVPNEVICAEIGRMIGLPIPPSSVTYSSDGTMWFSSLYFNFDEDELPDVFPDCFWRDQPDWFTAVMVFDVFVMNGDRHVGNLAVDDPLNPKVCRVFDHDQALLGGGDKVQGLARLEANADRLGLNTATGGMRNDFIYVMTDSNYMTKWVQRIKDLKDWMIDHCVDCGAQYGLTETWRIALRRFLKDRRKRLDSILFNNREQFVNVHKMRVMGKLL